MKRNEDFRKALGQPDEYFRRSVIDTLDQLNRQAEKESRPQRRYTTRIIASFAAVVLLVAGIILNRQYIPGISPDGHIDTINPTPTVATQVAESSSIVDTAYATMVFKEAVRDGDNIRFTLEIQPKQEKNLILSANHLLTSACKYTADFYGIQPKDPEQSMYSWVVDHGYQEALAVSLNSPWDGTEGPFYGSYQEEKCQLRDDGSAVMTLVGPAADDNVYELEWHIVPWNMEDKGNSFHPDLHNHGTIRLAVEETQIFAVAITPSTMPDLESSDGYNNASQKNDSSVMESDLATVTFLDAVIQNYEIHLSFDVRPKHEKCFVMDLQHQSLSRCKYVSDFYGIQADDPEQTLLQWLKEHCYEEMMHVSIAPPNNGEYGSFRTESYQRMDDGSVRMTIVGPALSDSLVYDIEWDATDYQTGRTHNQSESQIMHLDLSETGVTTLPPSETPSAQTELADLTIQKAVYGGQCVYVNVEVAPKHEDCLILNSGIDPYADSPERIGKTSDYEGQSIMKWAAEHGQKVVRLRISTAFDKETPMEPNVIYTVPAPAFSAEIEEHVEYRDDGTSVIRAIGTAVPNLQVYRLQFIMHEMDMSKAYSFTSDANGNFTMIEDSQTIATLAFTVSELDEEPQILAEYKSQPDPDQAEPEPEITVTLLRTSFYDCYDVRLPNEVQALSTDIYGKEHNFFPFLKKTDSIHVFGEQGAISANQAVTKEDGAYIYRCTWIFPDELPDALIVDNGVFRREVVRVK